MSYAEKLSVRIKIRKIVFADRKKINSAAIQQSINLQTHPET